MAITLDGTNGVTTPDVEVSSGGSASAPAITVTGDTNTGIFFPAADTIAFAEGGAEVARFDSSGNFAVGTTTPTTFGGFKTFEYVNSSGNAIQLVTGTGVIAQTISSNSNSLVYMGARSNHGLVFTTNDTERARITSSGYFKASNTGTYDNSSGVYHEFQSNNTDWLLRTQNTSASPYGIRINYTSANPNNTGSWFLYCDDANLRASIRSNGGLANYSANNVNLSDRREKTNFAPAKNYLDTICSIPVQTFNYIDQAEDDPGLTLGVVAQDVQEVAPELVMESNWAGKDEEPRMRLSIYQTDFQYALMKSIQELKAINDAQASRIETLEAKVAALEANT